MNSLLHGYSLSLRLAFVSCLAWSAITPSNALAVQYSSGDVFAAVGNFGVGGKVEHYDKNLNWLETLDTGISGFLIEQAGMAFDQSGNLYVTNRAEFDIPPTINNSVSRFDNQGTLLTPNPFVFADPGSSVESIVFDASGNFYVGQAYSVNNPTGSKDVIKFAPDGTRLASYTVDLENSGSDAIDLAADQLTLFYTSEGRRIKRFDVGTNTQLPDFAKLPGILLPSGDPIEAFDLRLLSDGGLLVADTENIKRLDSLGYVIQTYDLPGEDSWFALNLDPDGTSFWSGGYGTNTFCKFDIANSGGTPLCRTTVTQGGDLLGLTVFNEITQAVPSSFPIPTPLPNPDPGNNPTPEPGTVLLLGTGLVGVAIWRWREQYMKK